MRLLLIEDDLLLGQGLSTALKQAGLNLDWFDRAKTGLNAALSEDFDLLLLDLSLPDGDGLSLLTELRRRHKHLPVLILTARDALTDRVAGLDAGADDYLLKPFELAELLARIRALTRRRHGRSQSLLSYGQLQLHTDTQQVYLAGNEIQLSRREYALLLCLLEQRGRVLSRQQLEQQLYSWTDEIDSNALEVHIHHLRKKIAPRLIRTLRGVGYLIEPQPQEPLLKSGEVQADKP